MTRASFIMRDGNYVGFEIEGHSGYAPIGQDIVCAGISMASYMAVEGMKEVCGDYLIEIESKVGYMRCTLTEDTEIHHTLMSKVQSWVKVLYKVLEETSKHYPENLKVEVLKI